MEDDSDDDDFLGNMDDFSDEFYGLDSENDDEDEDISLSN